MVYRVYVEKRAPYDEEAQRALAEFSALPGAAGLRMVRILNRYDVEGIDAGLFEKCLPVVFSEPQVDDVLAEIPEADAVFAVEYLPGQFDQRADSAAECIQLVSGGERPSVLSAKVYLLYGEVGEAFEAWERGGSGLGEELADVAIYLLGLAEILHIDLGAEVERKMEINRRRRYAVVDGVWQRLDEDK